MSKVTGPLFKWFGSKWSASKYYPAPTHEIVVEPYAGSAGYSLRHADKRVSLAEKNQQVRTLWYWLIKEARESDIREIPLNIPEGTDIRSLDLSYGQSLLLKHWQRTNNVGNCWTVSPWGNKPGQWTENTRSRVASEFHLIKHWQIDCDAFNLFNEAEEFAKTDEPCTWFIDPPYEFNYQYRLDPIDYNMLASSINNLPGQIIVCEAICSKTGKVPNWLPFEPFRNTVTSRRKATNNHHSKELIYTR